MLCTQAKRESDLSGLKGLETHAGIDVLFQNCVGIFRRDLLDFHAARSRCHENRLALGTVDQNSEIEFFFDGQRFFDQKAAYDAAFGAGLVRDQFHAQHFGGEVAGFVHRLGDLHAAALAAATSVDLRLDHHSAGAGIE